MSGPNIAAVLLNAQVAYKVILKAQALSIEGREKEAGLAWSGLCRFIERELPVLERIIAAQAEAAEPEHLAKGGLICGAFRGVAAPHPDAPQPHVANPEQPMATA